MNSTQLLDLADKLRILADSIQAACGEQPKADPEIPADPPKPKGNAEQFNDILLILHLNGIFRFHR
jgi:hypothetical protein